MSKRRKSRNRDAALEVAALREDVRRLAQLDHAVHAGTVAASVPANDRADLHVALMTARNGRPRNEEAAGVTGWTLSGDTPQVLGVRAVPSQDGFAAVAVTDGMGGNPAGDVAAQVASRELVRTAEGDDGIASISEHVDPGDPAGVARDALLRADVLVRSMAYGPSAGMGCAAAVLVVTADGAAAVGNVGDVRAYRLRDGHVGLLTTDDRSEPESNLLSACIGGTHERPLSPHVSENLRLQPRDRILLCSDGLYDTVEEQEIGRLAGGPIIASAEALVEAATARGPGDNVTVALIDLIPADHVP